MAKKEYTAEDLLVSRIEDIISDELYIERVPYSLDDTAMQVSYESRKNAAIKIVEMLKKENLLTNEIS